MKKVRLAVAAAAMTAAIATASPLTQARRQQAGTRPHRRPRPWIGYKTWYVEAC